MQLAKHASKIAYGYAGLSLIIGPAIVWFNTKRAPAFGDCYDNAWGGMSASAKNSLLNSINLSMRIEAVAMIVIGFLVVGLLFKDEQSRSTIRVPGLLSVVIILIGYAAILAVSLSPANCP